jgi:hypothetical protein
MLSSKNRYNRIASQFISKEISLSEDPYLPIVGAMQGDSIGILVST